MIGRIMRLVPATLLVAAVTHVALLYLTPSLVMRAVLAGAAERAGVNAPAHSAKTTAATRFVPLPSPDLLYSTCVLDLSGGPVDVSVVPGSTYLSLSIFDAQTNNVFVASDRSAGGKPIVLRVAAMGGAMGDLPTDAVPVRVSSERALLLLRGLASTPELAAISDAARHTLRCGRAG